MPQTLLALLALALSSLVVFNQQRLHKRAQTNMISNEVQLASSGLASDILAMVGARSFDEYSTPEKIHIAQAVPASPTVFTAASSLGKGASESNTCDLLAPTDDCDDIDDVHGISKAEYDILLAEGRSLPFEVSTTVAYVTDAEGKTVSSTPTRHKRVTIRVESGTKGVHTAPLEFSRVFSYDPVKAEMDYERIYGPIGAGKGNGSGDGSGDGSDGGGTHTQNGDQTGDPSGDGTHDQTGGQTEGTATDGPA